MRSDHIDIKMRLQKFAAAVFLFGYWHACEAGMFGPSNYSECIEPYLSGSG